MFEYKVPNCFNFFDNITLEGYEKRKQFISERYRNKIIYGFLICKTRQESLTYWKETKKGNWTAKIGEYIFTIIKSQFGKTTILFMEIINVYGNIMEKNF